MHWLGRGPGLQGVQPAGSLLPRWHSVHSTDSWSDTAPPGSRRPPPCSPGVPAGRNPLTSQRLGDPEGRGTAHRWAGGWGGRT